MASKNWKDLDLSTDEVKRIGEALKDEQFRKLFMEYAEEISDPENRRRYEEEISQMERERGMDVQFIHPKPGYVLKTIVDNEKAFVNICQNDKIGKPSSQPQVSSDGKRGLHWQIPHSHSPPREELIKNGQKCKVFDVVYHPDTVRMTENMRFKKMVEDIAFDGIVSRFGVSIDKKNVKYMKNIQYKGIPVATVLRTKSENVTEQSESAEILKDMPYPYDSKTSAEKTKEMMDKVKKKQESQEKGKYSKKEEENGPTEPKYTIIHRSNMDIQEYRNAPDARTSTRPKELEVQIELPLLNSAKEVELDVFEQKINLVSNEPAKYKLELKLPYPVDDENGSARFDKSKRRLILTLPVQPPEEVELPTFIKEVESGIQEKPVDDNIGPQVYEDSKLIEELPPLEDIEETQSEIDTEKNSEDHTIGDPERQTISNESLYPTPQLSYSFPDFTFSQDDKTVSFVLQVKNVSHESITKSFPSPNVCQVKFLTLGSGGFPMHYSFLVQFPEDNTLVPDHCSSDVSDLNVVLLLLKTREARGSWTDFQTGTGMDDLQGFTFVTESSLQKELDQLEAEATGNHQTEKQPVANIHVTEMNKKKLSIKVQKANAKSKKAQKEVENPRSTSQSEEEELEEEDNGPSSAEIQIFHEKNIPNLHSILKQRSMSESSDDLSSSHGSGSPISPRDDLMASKKSVHFNDRIDKTTFKPGTAVTSMTKALKSKRRRNRKREEKRNGRMRQNSGGSEGSTSGDDHDLCRTSVTEEEEEENNEFCNQVIDEICREEALKEMQNNPTSSVVVEKENIESNVKGTSVPAESQVQMKVKVIKDKISEERTSSSKADSDDDQENESDQINDGSYDSSLKSFKSDQRTSLNKCSSQGDVKDSKGVGDSKSEKSVSKEIQSVKGVRELSEKVGDSNENDKRVRELVEGTKVVNVDDVKNCNGILDLKDNDTDILKIVQDDKQNGNDSGVECSLDTSETQGDTVQENDTQGEPGPEDLNSMDHKTKCAFQFSNALMFDLDED